MGNREPFVLDEESAEEIGDLLFSVCPDYAFSRALVRALRQAPSVEQEVLDMLQAIARALELAEKADHR